MGLHQVEITVLALGGALLGIVVLFVTISLWPRGRRVTPRVYRGDASLLLHHLSDPIPLKTVTVNGHHCTVLTDYKGSFLAQLLLKKPLGVHIIALSRRGLRSRGMFFYRIFGRFERVDLEGHFPNHFVMYCSPGHQAEVRQLFEPVTMWQFVELCRSYNFELYGSAVYFAPAKGRRDRHDTTDMATDIVDFLEQNKRFLAGKLL